MPVNTAPKLDRNVVISAGARGIAGDDRDPAFCVRISGKSFFVFQPRRVHVGIHTQGSRPVAVNLCRLIPFGLYLPSAAPVVPLPSSTAIERHYGLSIAENVLHIKAEATPRSWSDANSPRPPTIICQSYYKATNPTDPQISWYPARLRRGTPDTLSSIGRTAL